MSNVLRRAGWLFLAALFILTGLGVGVIAFWQATHQDKSQPNTAQQADASKCQFDTPAAQTISLPQAYKPSGDVTKLDVTDLEAGTGAAIKPGDCITVKYYGTLASDGKVFDENFDKSQALKYQFGAGLVIQGWEQGLDGMKVGGTRRLVIPSNLAYGDQAAGSIPANADLVFVVKLLDNK